MNLLPNIGRRAKLLLALGINLSSVRTKFTLPDLPYDYNALEPVISAEIMQLHHQKHHQAYINNLNAAMEKLEEARHANNLIAIVGLQSQIKFNGGGDLNHSIFWKNLCPPDKAKGEPSGKSEYFNDTILEDLKLFCYTR